MLRRELVLVVASLLAPSSCFSTPRPVPLAVRPAVRRCPPPRSIFTPAYDTTQRYSAIDWAKNMRTLPNSVTPEERLALDDAIFLSEALAAIRVRKVGSAREGDNFRSDLLAPFRSTSSSQCNRFTDCFPPQLLQGPLVVRRSSIATRERNGLALGEAEPLPTDLDFNRRSRFLHRR